MRCRTYIMNKIRIKYSIFYSCEQQYKSVERFYDSFPDSKNGPPYPLCTSTGMFVKRQCNSATSVCRCVQPEDGETLPGSEFWGPNSAFEIDCDKCKFVPR